MTAGEDVYGCQTFSAGDWGDSNSLHHRPINISGGPEEGEVGFVKRGGLPGRGREGAGDYLHNPPLTFCTAEKVNGRGKLVQGPFFLLTVSFNSSPAQAAILQAV